MAVTVGGGRLKYLLDIRGECRRVMIKQSQVFFLHLLNKLKSRPVGVIDPAINHGNVGSEALYSSYNSSSKNNS